MARTHENGKRGRGPRDARGGAADVKRLDELFDAPLVVPREQSGLPLDKFLATLHPELDRGYLRELIRSGCVHVDGTPMTSSRALWGNAVVTVEPEGSGDAQYHEEEAPAVKILFESDELVVIDKPAGISVHPRSLAEILPGVRLVKGETLHVAARVDKEISGVVPVAKTLACARWMEALHEAGRVLTELEGVVRGAPREDDFEIALPLGPDERRSGRRVVDRQGGSPARTRVRVERRFDGYASIVATPLTDATHQVRAHLAAVGFPLAVDPMYGDRTSLSLSDLKRGYASKPGRRERPILERTALHGGLFECELPSGRAARVKCPAPGDLTRLVAALERYRAPFDLDDDEAP